MQGSSERAALGTQSPKQHHGQNIKKAYNCESLKAKYYKHEERLKLVPIPGKKINEHSLQLHVSGSVIKRMENLPIDATPYYYC